MHVLPFRLWENSCAATRRRSSQATGTLVVVKRQLSMTKFKPAERKVNTETEECEVGIIKWIAVVRSDS